MYHGNGGFDWHTVYNMPIWLRKFTLNKIIKFLNEKNEAQKSTSPTTGGNKSRQIDFAKPPPDIKPGQMV